MTIRLTTFAAVVLAVVACATARAQAPADTAIYAVSYVDVIASSGSTLAGAYRQYSEASRKEEGFGRIELFEQVGRPGHFVVIERWADQKAFDAHGAAPHAARFREALQPIRVSGYDQRPYKALSVVPGRDGGTGQAVHVVAHVDVAGAGALAESPGILRRLADASRSEPGSVRFEVLQHAMRLNHFTVFETWQNQQALDAHAATAHAKQYRDAIQPISGSPLDERVFKAVQ